MNRIFGIPLTNVSDGPPPGSGLTLAKLIAIRDMFTESERKEEERMRREGYWTVEARRFPRSKSRRIRRKWMRSGRTLKIVFIPPVKAP